MQYPIFLVVAFLAGATPLRAEVTNIDNIALERLLAGGVPVVDVRTPEEWNRTGVIQGSHLLTFFDSRGRYDVRAWMSELAAIAVPDEPIAIICHSGGRSNVVSRLLDRQFGYRRVHNVHGGIAQWIAENRPTVNHR